jgi:chemotaxis protein methyltransferase CheR
MREFLQALCSDLATTIVGDQPISISVSADQVHLAAEQAVPVGLIVNEAVTNALKYAFPQGGAGRIAVELRRRGDDKLCLEIMDNGWGRESGSQDETASSGGTGTRLIQALARQLDGDAEWQGPPGTRVVVTVTQRL